MLSIAKRQILPASRVPASGGRGGGSGVRQRRDPEQDAVRVCELVTTLENGIGKLEEATAKAAATTGCEAHAESYAHDVLPAMGVVRAAADELETLVDAKLWPLPIYAEMLFLR